MSIHPISMPLLSINVAVWMLRKLDDFGLLMVYHLGYPPQ